METFQFPASILLESCTLEALEKNGGKATNDQIREFAVSKLNLKPEQLTLIHSGSRTELEYRLAWARTRAKRKGLLIKIGKGMWALPKK